MLAMLAGVFLKICRRAYDHERLGFQEVEESDLSREGGCEQLGKKPPLHWAQGVTTGKAQCSTIVLHRGLQQLNEECSKGIGTDGIRAVELVEKKNGCHPLGGEGKEVSLLEEHRLQTETIVLMQTEGNSW